MTTRAEQETLQQLAALAATLSRIQGSVRRTDATSTTRANRALAQVTGQLESLSDDIAALANRITRLSANLNNRLIDLDGKITEIHEELIPAVPPDTPPGIKPIEEERRRRSFRSKEEEETT